MQLKDLVTIVIPAAVSVAGVAALAVSLSVRVPSAAASTAESGQLHVTKNCSNYTGLAGSYCTVTSSNLPQIPAGSTVFYTQAPTAAPETGSIGLDSNVVLFVRFGDWAVGRCTLDSRQYPGNYGLCTFSNGVGPLAGFTARVEVSPFENTPTDVNYHWDGTYSFTPVPPE
jgi:hypothetical protein